MVSDRRSGLAHPLIYSHPKTGLATLCFHLGMTEGFVLEYDNPEVFKKVSIKETNKILQQIYEEILKNPGNIYHHKYKLRDFLISDKLAVGHEASPDTQWSSDKIGLRVMHRVTVAGTTKPTKSI